MLDNDNGLQNPYTPQHLMQKIVLAKWFARKNKIKRHLTLYSRRYYRQAPLLVVVKCTNVVPTRNSAGTESSDRTEGGEKVKEKASKM